MLVPRILTSEFSTFCPSTVYTYVFLMTFKVIRECFLNSINWYCLCNGEEVFSCEVGTTFFNIIHINCIFQSNNHGSIGIGTFEMSSLYYICTRLQPRWQRTGTIWPRVSLFTCLCLIVSNSAEWCCRLALCQLKSVPYVLASRLSVSLATVHVSEQMIQYTVTIVDQRFSVRAPSPHAVNNNFLCGHQFFSFHG